MAPDNDGPVFRAEHKHVEIEGIGMRHGILKRLVDTVNLSEIDRLYRKTRRRVGRRGNNITNYIRAWIIQRLKNIPSERQLTRLLKTDGELRHICGFRKAVCNSSFCRARKRFTLRDVESLFEKLVQMAIKAGIADAKIVAIDSTDFEANCKGNKPFSKRIDTCARWGHSTIKGRVFGYKAHILADVKSELPLAVVVLPANVNDAKAFFEVFAKLPSNILASMKKLLADAGYDSTDIRAKLRDIESVIAVNGRGFYKSRTPLDEDYPKRWAVERVNSRAKEELSLDGFKMYGLWAAKFHATIVLCSMLYAAIGSKLAGFANWRSIVNLR